MIDGPVGLDHGTHDEELCATTGWPRNHARKALAQALRPKVVRPRRARPPIYGPEVVAALVLCWARASVDESTTHPSRALLVSQRAGLTSRAGVTQNPVLTKSCSQAWWSRKARRSAWFLAGSEPDLLCAPGVE